MQPVLMFAVVMGAAIATMMVPAARTELRNTRPELYAPRPPAPMFDLGPARRLKVPRGGLRLPARPLRHTTATGRKITPKRGVPAGVDRYRSKPGLEWVWEGWEPQDSMFWWPSSETVMAEVASDG